MNLYLVQHALAKSKEEDPRRSLSERGLGELEKTASFVSSQTTIEVKRIVHSGKNRARQTAEIFSKYLTPVEGVTPAEGLNPMDDPGWWVEKLSEEPDNLMLVGHLPHLDKLASRLLCGRADAGPVAFQNAGIVCLTKTEPDIWEITAMITAQLLK